MDHARVAARTRGKKAPAHRETAGAIATTNKILTDLAVPLSFITASRESGSVVITNQFGETPLELLKPNGEPVFKDIILYQHQRIIANAILECEETKIITIAGYSQATSYQSRAVVLSDALGSGKSFIILTVIGLSPIPRAVSAHILNGVRVKNTSKMALINSTLIVVGSSVLVQWNNYIANSTTLSHIKIGDVFDLRKFYRAYMEGTAIYDIVLLKSGMTTGSFMLPGETVECDQRHLCTVMQLITQNRVWARVVIDDFDTINIDGKLFNALATIYVSGSTRNNSSKSSEVCEFASLELALASERSNITDVMGDSTLFEMFNIKSSPQLLQQSTAMPVIDFYMCVYTNPDDKIIGLIGDFGANQVVEMLNGDAIKSAAGKLGIEATGTSDILKRILDNNYVSFKRNSDTIRVIDKFEEVADMLNPHAKGIAHGAVELLAIRNTLIKLDMPDTDFWSPALIELIDEMRAQFTKLRNRDGAALDRVMSNLREGACGTCNLPLMGSDVIIMRCCGLILDAACSVRANHVYGVRGKLVGNCAKCTRNIDPLKDFIFVGAAGTSLDDLLTKDIEPAPREAEPHAELPPPAYADNPKLAAIVQIARGREPIGASQKQIDIANIMKGADNNPYARGASAPVPKVIVFASQRETLELIEDTLEKERIEFLRMGGTATDMARTIATFKHGSATVLLIDSTSHCAGANLQFATDLVLYHDVFDEGIKSQMIGRIQRIGRVNNARVWFLRYSNENR